MSNWISVYASVPPEETSVVDDDAMDWAVWVEEDGDGSVTIYKEDDEYVVVTGVEHMEVRGRYENEDDALDRAAELREE